MLNRSIGLRGVGNAVRIVGIAVGELELNGGVHDAVIMLQHVIDAVQQAASALHGDVANHQVAGERGAGSAQRPDVQMMNAVHAVDRSEGALNGGGVDAAGVPSSNRFNASR